MNDSMYKEQIMDHFKHPRNFGKLSQADVNFTDYNPFCGDEITIQVKFEKDTVKDIKFHGKGCAISQASASLLTELVKEKKVEELRNIKNEQIVELLGIPLGPVRIKCALLGLKALQKGLINYLGGKEDAITS